MSEKPEEKKEENIVRKYKNGNVTVVWRPDRCQHSGICTKGLPMVFDIRKRPWIDMKGASPVEIVKQVQQCPSHALSFEFTFD